MLAVWGTFHYLFLSSLCVCLYLPQGSRELERLDSILTPISFITCIFIRIVEMLPVWRIFHYLFLSSLCVYLYLPQRRKWGRLENISVLLSSVSYVYQNWEILALRSIQLLISIFIMCLFILASEEQKVRETGQYFNALIIYLLYIYHNRGNIGSLQNISLLISIFIVCLHSFLRGAEGKGDWTIFQCSYHLSLVYLSE